MFAVSVVRTSTTRQELINQTKIVQDYIRNNKWNEENNVSVKRSGYSVKWENDIIKHIVNNVSENTRHLVFSCTDRLSRNMVAVCKLLDKLRYHDLTLHFIVDGIQIHVSEFFPATPLATQVFTLINNGQTQSANLGDKVKRTKELLRENYSAFTGGKVSNGYTLDTLYDGEQKYKVLKRIPGYDDLIQLMEYLYYTRKMAYNKIAELLNTKSIYNPKHVSGEVEYFLWDKNSVKQNIDKKQKKKYTLPRVYKDEFTKLSTTDMLMALTEEHDYDEILDEKCFNKQIYVKVCWDRKTNNVCWVPKSYIVVNSDTTDTDMETHTDTEAQSSRNVKNTRNIKNNNVKNSKQKEKENESSDMDEEYDDIDDLDYF